LLKVTVIDVTGAQSRPDMTVIVAGNRIAAVGKTGKVQIPKNAQIIDASGRFLIPGLWDMHAHTLTDNRQEYAFPLLIANGVTGIREMGSNLSSEEVNKIRQDVLSGTLPGPRFGALTYKILDGAGTQLSTAIAVATPDEGRRLVRTYKQSGADFIKPYNLLSRDVYLAILDEAKRQRIAVEGHTPFSMTAAEVSDLGQSVIEHNFGVLLSCSSDEEALRKQTQSQASPWLQTEAKAAATYDSRKAKKLFERFARNRTWVCPTLSFQKLYPVDGSDRAALAARYIPRSQLDTWRLAYERAQRNLLPQYRKLREEMLSKIIGEMYRAGVGILAGTDTGAFFAVPGFSLHDELEELVKAGLSPIEALRTATLNPAIFLHKEKASGAITKGKLADLVLLDANPLINISNTRKINAVIVDGRLLDRETLNKMLADVEAATNKQ
jgi:imidazolonepropionase-like amidohydrolase